MPAKRIFRLALPSLFAAFLLVAAPPVSGQQEASLEIGEEALVEFARVHARVTQAKEKHQGELARMHDTQGKDRLREEFALQMDQIFLEHETTRAEYERITAIISVDPHARERFEQILRDLVPPSRDTLVSGSSRT